MQLVYLIYKLEIRFMKNPLLLIGLGMPLLFLFLLLIIIGIKWRNRIIIIGSLFCLCSAILCFFKAGINIIQIVKGIFQFIEKVLKAIK